MGQLESALLATKRDYELLRIEFERTIASNEQAAPIAKELKVSYHTGEGEGTLGDLEESQLVTKCNYHCSYYRMARNFRGLKFSLFSRINREPRKFYPRNFTSACRGVRLER